MSGENTAEALGFDPDALRAKYREERRKRLREDGNDQYLEVTGKFAHYVNDPYVEPGFKREPLSDEVDVVVIGGGFGGLQTGARLREAGVEDIRIIEKAGDFGGTWYWNRYPGAACDVESYVYMPLLEELDYVPTRKYAKASEILAHSQAIGRHYDLYENALFQTEVTELCWDEELLRWIVHTNRDDRIKARFVAMANGPMHRPKLPGIPGIQTFQGHTFHTSRWDYAYTGGDPESPLDGLRDKRIAIIGTGATAVQCVPPVGAAARQLYVFQRTPSSIDVRNDRPTDPEWAASLDHGWQKQRVENFNNLVSGVPQEVDLVNDGWTDIIGKTIERFKKSAAQDPSKIREVMELANFEKMNEIRDRVDELVDDPKTAEALKPYYRMFCKRPCFHDSYLQTFNRPNVPLVDTDGKGVDEITERAVVVQGTEYQVDCIIFATGFEVGTGFSRRAGYETYGRNGQSLSEKWSTGVRTLHGMHSRGFPNCFIIGASQGGFAVNYPQLLDEVGSHLAHIIGHALKNDIKTVEVTEEAEEQWVQTILAKASRGGGSPASDESCTPGYYNNEGKPSPLARQGAPYGGGAIRFWRILHKWRQAGAFEGLELQS